MKKIFTRIISIIIVCALLTAAFPQNVSASEFYYYDDDNTIISKDENYEYVVLDENAGTIMLKGYKGTNTEIVIPSNIDGYTVTEIGSSAFAFENFTSVELPEGLISIGTWAFYLAGITNIEIPSTVEVIDELAFGACDIDNVYIPASVKYIGEGAFFSCKDSITVSENNKYYSSQDGVLYNKKKTELLFCPKEKTKVKVASTIETIYGTDEENMHAASSGAFTGCRKLVRVTLPEGLKKISAMAFSGCTNLKKINIPSTVTYIGYSAFNNCKKLTKLTLGDNLTTIGETAFAYCKNLKTLTIGKNVKMIGKSAFEDCKNLSKITIKSKKLKAGNVDYNAFSGIKTEVKIKVPKSKLKKYTKILYNRGIKKKKAKIVAI